MSKKPTLAERAVEYARRGFHVFPLSPGSKQPLPGSRGYMDATADPEDVAAAWREHPDANIGIYPAASGLMVLDFDTKLAGWDRQYAEFCGGAVLGGLVVRTPSGGFHHYLRLPEGRLVGSSASRVAPGVDVRCEGGYVLAPGSVVDGRGYVLDSASFSPNKASIAPPWLVDKAAPPGEKAENADDWLVEADLPHNVERAVRWLEGTDPAISGRGGNNHTYATAEILRDFGISSQTAFNLMEEHFNPRCVPPWSPDELLSIVRNSYCYAKRPAGTRARTAEFDRKLDEVAALHEAEIARARKGLRSLILAGRQILVIPPRKWVIEDAVQACGVGAIIGKRGSYKSFMALEMALCVQHGVPWAAGTGHDGYRTEQGPAMYFAGEAPTGIQERIAAWYAAHPGLEPAEDQPWLVKRVPHFRDEAEIRAWAQIIAEDRPRMVVVDTLFRAAAGLKLTEDGDASLFLERAEWLRDAMPDGVLMFVAHPPKTGDQEEVFGSTVLGAGMDFIFPMERPDRGEIVQFRNNKQKDTDELPQITFQRHMVDVPQLGRSIPVFRRTERHPTAREVMERSFVDQVERALLDEPGRAFDESTLAHKLAQPSYCSGSWETHRKNLQAIRNGASKIEGSAALRDAYYVGQTEGPGMPHRWRAEEF